MSYHSKKEFRALCGGLTIQYLATYISRKKVLLRADDLIDDSLELNKSFMAKQQKKNNGVVSMEALEVIDREAKARMNTPKEDRVPKPKREPKPKAIPKPKAKKEVKDVPISKEEYVAPVKEVVAPVEKPKKEFVVDKSLSNSENSNTEFDLEKKKKLLELEKLHKEVELKDMEIRKKLGELIPVSLVEGVFSRHSNNFVKTFKLAADRLADDMSNLYGIDRAATGSYRKKLIEEINVAIQDTIDITKKEIDSIVNEYSQSKR